ncbi:flavin-containing monooxygenase [Microbacterium sp. gxy059]|uniref:flavin-containing monooxygenase n=1 Tax=Microbacterium sp. gxy059 TaxID=2957199 RepID=UPI003D994917
MTTRRVGTVVVGAGFAGIAQALALRDAGVDDVVILERADRIGGTWRDNTYPGIACDVPSHLYGLESHPWPHWSRVFAPGAEIRSYLERIVADEGLDRRLMLGTALAGARWDGETWRIEVAHRGGPSMHDDAKAQPHPPEPAGSAPLDDGMASSCTGTSGEATAPPHPAPAHRGGPSMHDDAIARPGAPAASGSAPSPGESASSCTGAPAPDRPATLVADHLILACGRLTEPRIPEIRGLDTFPGPLFHTARWDHAALPGDDLRGRRIGVVGTGASAVQLVPALVARGAEVVLFQRSPAWIVPRDDAPVDASERRRFADDPDALRAHRAALYAEGEARFASRSGDERAAAEARAVALAHLERQVPDPALRRALTPDYAFGCKRVLLSDDFYPAVAGDAVVLEAFALAAVRGSVLVAASGRAHEVDALVLATGFETTRQPYAHLVRGEGGTTLDAHWSEGMTAVASTLVPGFPSLFVLNGPNASLGHNSSVLLSEAQAEFAARLIATGSGPVRVTEDEERRATEEIAVRAARTPWLTGGCANWYVDDRSRRLALLWPGTVADFRARLADALPDPVPEGAS